MQTVAPVFDLLVPTNADLRHTWRKRLEDDSYFDFTGYTATGQIRATRDSASTLILDLGEYLEVDATRIRLVVPKADLADVDFETGFWDLLLESPTGAVERFLEGPVERSEGVTE